MSTGSLYDVLGVRGYRYFVYYLGRATRPIFGQQYRR